MLWDKPVAIDITGRYERGAKNRIAVRVHDARYAGGIWKPARITASE